MVKLGFEPTTHAIKINVVKCWWLTFKFTVYLISFSLSFERSLPLKTFTLTNVFIRRHVMGRCLLISKVDFPSKNLIQKGNFKSNNAWSPLFILHKKKVSVGYCVSIYSWPVFTRGMSNFRMGNSVTEIMYMYILRDLVFICVCCIMIHVHILVQVNKVSVLFCSVIRITLRVTLPYLHTILCSTFIMLCTYEPVTYKYNI